MEEHGEERRAPFWQEWEDANQQNLIRAYFEAYKRQVQFYVWKKQQDKNFNLDAALTTWNNRWLDSIREESWTNKTFLDSLRAWLGEQKTKSISSLSTSAQGKSVSQAAVDLKVKQAAETKLNEMFGGSSGALTLKPSSSTGMSDTVRSLFLPRFTASYRQSILDVLLEAQAAGIDFKLNLDNEANIRPSLRKTFFFEALKNGVEASRLVTTQFAKYMRSYKKKHPGRDWSFRQAELKQKRELENQGKKSGQARPQFAGMARANNLGANWVAYTQPEYFFSPALSLEDKEKYIREMSYFQKFALAMNRDCLPGLAQHLLKDHSDQELIDCFNHVEPEWWHRAIRLFSLLPPIRQKTLLHELNPGLQRAIYLTLKDKERRYLPLPWKDLYEVTISNDTRKMLDALRSQAIVPTGFAQVLIDLGLTDYQAKRNFVSAMRRLNQRGSRAEDRDEFLNKILVDGVGDGNQTSKQMAAKQCLAASLCWVDKDSKRLLEIFSKIKKKYPPDAVFSILSLCGVRVVSKLAERGALEEIGSDEFLQKLNVDQRAAVFLARWKDWGKKHFYEYLGAPGSLQEQEMLRILNEPGVVQALAKEGRGRRPFRNRFRFISGMFDLESEKARASLDRILKNENVNFETKLLIADKLLSLLRNHLSYKDKVLPLLRECGFLEAASRGRIAQSLSDENVNLYRALHMSEQSRLENIRLDQARNVIDGRFVPQQDNEVIHSTVGDAADDHHGIHAAPAPAPAPEAAALDSGADSDATETATETATEDGYDADDVDEDADEEDSIASSPLTREPIRAPTSRGPDSSLVQDVLDGADAPAPAPAPEAAALAGSADSDATETATENSFDDGDAADVGEDADEEDLIARSTREPIGAPTYRGSDSSFDQDVSDDADAPAPVAAADSDATETATATATATATEDGYDTDGLHSDDLDWGYDDSEISSINASESHSIRARSTSAPGRLETAPIEKTDNKDWCRVVEMLEGLQRKVAELIASDAGRQALSADVLARLRETLQEQLSIASQPVYTFQDLENRIVGLKETYESCSADFDRVLSDREGMRHFDNLGAGLNAEQQLSVESQTKVEQVSPSDEDPSNGPTNPLATLSKPEVTHSSSASSTDISAVVAAHRGHSVALVWLLEVGGGSPLGADDQSPVRDPPSPS